MAVQAVVEALRRQIAHWEGRANPAAPSALRPSFLKLERLLPAGGFLPGTLVEWLASEPGSGTETLALAVARQACAGGKALVVVEAQRELYSPAAARLGVALDRLVIARAPREADLLWALEQSLRCPAVGAVVCRLDRLAGRDFRRLQLAAEEGQTLGLLIRPDSAKNEPSWADVRFWVEPRTGDRIDGPRHWKATVLRCRGGPAGATALWEFDDAADFVSLPSSRR